MLVVFDCQKLFFYFRAGSCCKYSKTVTIRDQYHITQGLGFYLFRVGTIATVAAVMALLAVLLVAQMLVQFRLQHLFNARNTAYTKTSDPKTGWGNMQEYRFVKTANPVFPGAST